MWPTRRDMNRDECRKYLRYLELDAYGSMVSVLRAQGPFSSEKQKLLQELARVLHISNERHRAEVRRAANDEKLTQVAEQLGGSNTGIDWTIEGRRTIPLLPRLKARSAFTTLANSLSLATAAANERKAPVLEKPEQSKDIYESQVKVKLEESSSDTDETVPDNDELTNVRIGLEEVSDLKEEIDKRNTNHDIVQLSVASRKRKSPSPLPTMPPHKVLVISSSSVENSNHCTVNPLTQNADEPLQASSKTQQEQSVTVMPASPSSPSIEQSEDSMELANANNHSIVQTSNCISTTTTACTANASKSNVKTAVVQNKLNTKVVATHLSTGSSCTLSTSNPKSSTHNVQAQEETKVASTSQTLQKKLDLDHVNSTCTKRVTPAITSNAKSPPAKLVTSNNSQRVTAICPGTTVSSGPGPPQSKQTTLTCKKLSTTLNHQTTAKTGVTINSNKPVNISPHPNAKLASKTNVIVIQKGHNTKGVTLSHAGKEIVGKVIMGGKNLCVSTQNSGGNSIGSVPQQVAINNGDQSTNTSTSRDSTHTESAKPNVKCGNTIVFNVRQDVTEKKKVASQLPDSSSVLTSEPKTVIHNTNAHSLKEQTNNDLHIIDDENSVNDDALIESTIDANQETNDTDECENVNSHDVNSLDSIGSLENAEIVIDTGELIEDTDVSKIELKQIICSPTVAMDEKDLAAAEISFENVQYVVEGSDSYILETRSPIVTINQTNVLDKT